ncbi:MAG: hypothetical protein J6A13_05610 [Paludibacteraceae bacterium]|nr:hypothetical protein [Paludibacteraceae bacterium]MBO5405453.1 hypothetical protein [Paludibacteraceae bacterium]
MTYDEISTKIAEIANAKAPSSVTPQMISTIELGTLDYLRHLEDNVPMFESGRMPGSELYAWYAGTSCFINIVRYNIIGDFIFLSLEDMMLPEGWLVVYYSIPVQCVVPSHGYFKAAGTNQELYWSIAAEPATSVNVLRIAAVDDAPMKASKTSLIINYKCK